MLKILLKSKEKGIREAQNQIRGGSRYISTEQQGYFCQLEQLESDIERREHSSEMLELLHERFEGAIQSLYAIQEVLLARHRKPNILKCTTRFQIFHQVLRQELISYQSQNLAIYQLLRITKNLSEAGRQKIEMPYCVCWFNSAIYPLQVM